MAAVRTKRTKIGDILAEREQAEGGSGSVSGSGGRVSSGRGDGSGGGADPHELSVGAKMRCTFRSSPDATDTASTAAKVEERTTRVLVMCVDGQRVDVLVLGRKREVEATVAASDLSPLEPFELSPSIAAGPAADDDASNGAEALKGEANSLFKLKDYEAAAERYQQALAALKQRWPSNEVGSYVLVNVERRLRAGMVSDTEAGGSGAELEIMFMADQGQESQEDDEEEGVVSPSTCVAALAPPVRTLQCAILNNLARCHLALAAPGPVPTDPEATAGASRASSAKTARW